MIKTKYSVVPQVANSHNLYLNDIADLYDTILKTHPVFCLSDNKFREYRELFIELFEQIKSEENISFLRFELLVSRLLANLNDSHTAIFFKPSKNIFPFSFDTVNGKFFLSKISKEYSDITGKEVISFQGKSLEEMRAIFKPWFGYENEIKLDRTICYYLNNYDLLRELGLTNNTGAIAIETIDCKLLVKPVRFENMDKLSFHKINRRGHYITERQTVPFFYKILKDKNICYFQFNEMVDRNTYVMMSDMQNSGFSEYDKDTFMSSISHIPIFKIVLKDMLEDMKNQSVDKLIIDLRYNGGGNSLLWESLFKYISDIDIDKFNRGSSKIRISDFFKEVYPNLFIEYEKIDNAICNYDDKLIDDKILQNIDHYRSLFEPDGVESFCGKVLLIQGESTYSSAANFCVFVKDNNIFPVIGSKSSQKPTCFGDILFFELANTGIRGSISHKVFYRPDTTKNNDHYIIPDIEIPTSLSDMKLGIDPCWNFILEEM